jgi:hypothetical protein
MKSLPQGFCQALHRSTAEFFFFVEHDWYFIKRNIHHSLKDILNVMQRYESISIMRFTARRVLKYPEQTGSSFCLQSTESLDFIDASPSALYSNNPYLIKRELAHDLMGAFCSGPLDTVLPGKFESYSQHYCSGGFFKGSQKNETISECASIRRSSPCNIYEYGAIGSPATVLHLDGRNVGVKPNPIFENDEIATSLRQLVNNEIAEKDFIQTFEEHLFRIRGHHSMNSN